MRRGKKLLLIDEVGSGGTISKFRPSLRCALKQGGKENLEPVLATQLPRRINASISGRSTKRVCFPVPEWLASDCVGDLGGDREAVENLPLGIFISTNRIDSGSLTERF